MMRSVRVAVPLPLPRTFDYAVPENCPATVVGGRVRVPFAGRTLVGVCLAVDPEDAFADLKPVRELVDQEAALDEELMALASWLAAYYHYPIGEVFSAMLPNLVMRGVPLAPGAERVWRLNQGPKPDLSRAPRQRELLAFLHSNGGCAAAAELRAGGFAPAVVRALQAKGAIAAEERPGLLGVRAVAGPGAEVAGLAMAAAEQHLTLTADQDEALRAYHSCRQDCRVCGQDRAPAAHRAGGAAADPAQPAAAFMRGFSANLLEGVAGSGKTEVYLRAIGEVLRRGEQVLVLVPEIGLTPQTLARFRRRYGEVDALHSGLGDRQRLNAWLRCRAGAARILIGTRSAVFTPFRKLGLIVVDEEHDPSFKQHDRLRYSARDVAVKRAKMLDIPLILGSATPSLETLHNVRKGRYRHQRLSRRATGAPMPHIHILDIRGHVLQEGFSPPLIRRIRGHLDRRGQVLVFLNRRGYAPTYLCTSCGWQATCNACDARLTLHRKRRRLACHHCGAHWGVPSACPACERQALTPVGAGTERAQAGLQALFPEAPLIRIDRDTTRTQARLEAQLAKIREGGPGILVGTQMLAKGHHFPNITLVAVLNADAGFFSADFRAPERTAQLLTQVAGRAGRAGRPGEVCIQTLQPDNPALKRLVAQGYAGFAEHELAVRRAAALPPARHMALVRAAAVDAALPSPFLQELKNLLPGGIEVLGPAPAQMLRQANLHRHQLMLLSSRRGPLHEALDRLAHVKAPTGVRWDIDVDPLDAL